MFKLNGCWVDFWCEVQCKLLTPVNVVATSIIHILIHWSFIQPLWRIILWNLAFNNVIWTLNGFSVMSPFIEVFFQICMQLQARWILNTSSLASIYCQRYEFDVVTGACQKTIFKGNHLMKDYCHNCCSEEFTSLEMLSLGDFAAP